jgi:AcrR family transcriptional regulator
MTRTYDGTRRREQARATRRRVVEAARTLLLERGYADTTLAAVAQTADVSVETIYKSFGSKAALVKHVWDVTLIGDDEPVPLAQRPEFVAIASEADPRRKLAQYIALGLVLQQRLGPLWAIVEAGASAGNPELQELRATVERERLAGAERIVTQLESHLRGGLDTARARDVMWTLISPEMRRLLVDERRWSTEAYSQWLSQTLAETLLEPVSSDDLARPRVTVDETGMVRP